MAEEINIKINADATLEYDVKGVKGRKCRDLTKLIDAIAGGAIIESKVTGEFCQLDTNISSNLKQGQ